MQLVRNSTTNQPTNIASTPVDGASKAVDGALEAINGTSKAVNGAAIDAHVSAPGMRAALMSVRAALGLLCIVSMSAGRAIGQCHVTQQATGTGQPFVFNQFASSLGQPIEVRIVWTDVVTAGVTGQRTSSATNFVSVLCGARGVRLPGSVNSTNDDVRLCQTFFLNNNNTFSLALGVDTWTNSFQRIGASVSAYVGASTFTLTPTSIGYGGSVYQSSGPCPTYTPVFQPPCFNVPSSDGTFSSDFQITRSISVSVTYTYRCCDDTDFNNNGVFPEDQDVIDFFNVLAGGNCP